MSSWINFPYFILNVDICFQPLIVLKILESHYYLVEIRENNIKQSYEYITYTCISRNWADVRIGFQP